MDKKSVLMEYWWSLHGHEVGLNGVLMELTWTWSLSGVLMELAWTWSLSGVLMELAWTWIQSVWSIAGACMDMKSVWSIAGACMDMKSVLMDYWWSRNWSCNCHSDPKEISYPCSTIGQQPIKKGEDGFPLEQTDSVIFLFLTDNSRNITQTTKCCQKENMSHLCHVIAFPLW